METRKPAVNPVWCWRGGPGCLSARPGSGSPLLRCWKLVPMHCPFLLGGRRGGGRVLQGGPSGLQGLGQVGEPARQLSTSCHPVESVAVGNTQLPQMLKTQPRARKGPLTLLLFTCARGKWPRAPRGSPHPSVRAPSAVPPGLGTCTPELGVCDCVCTHTSLLFSPKG